MCPRRRRALLAALLLALLVVALAAPPPAARADGDPPSDVLLQQDVYYPYQDDVAPSLQAQLDELTARARKAGFPLKVALVSTPADLGSIPEFFGKPQRYARFLEGEIRYNRPQPLLTVMPNGYGADAAGPRSAALLARLPRLANADGNAMARGAIPAIGKLAAAAGHPFDTTHLTSPTRHVASRTPVTHRARKHHTSLLLSFAPLALIAVAALALAARQRRRPRGGDGARRGPEGSGPADAR